MALFDKLYGNTALKGNLASEIRNKRLPHALIIEGAPGSGKALLARSVCAALACKGGSPDFPCGVCDNCRRIYEDKCPDVVTIEKPLNKSSLSVQVVRFVIEKTYLSANSLPFKAFIIKNADSLTIQAQNAFLKSLEEPATELYYFLLCENASSFLPTILSRAPVIRTSPVSVEEIVGYINDNRGGAGLSPSQLNKIAFAGEGSIARALSVLDGTENGGIAEHMDLVLKFMDIYAQRKTKTDFLDFYLNLTLNKEETSEIFRLLQKALRDIIAVKKKGRELCFYFDESLAADHAKKIRLKSAFALLDLIDKTMEDIERNSNPANSVLLFTVQAWNAM